MKSNKVLPIIIVQMILSLWSCSGNEQASELILATGGETSTPVERVESEKSPATTQDSQSATKTTALSPTTVPETPVCDTTTATIKSTNAYLRGGPDLRFVTIAPYKKGDEFKLIGFSKDWFQVESSDGNTGWLYKEWLSLPSNLDTNNLCLIPVNVPTFEPDPTKCVPSYYDSCN